MVSSSMVSLDTMSIKLSSRKFPPCTLDRPLFSKIHITLHLADGSTSNQRHHKTIQFFFCQNMSAFHQWKVLHPLPNFLNLHFRKKKKIYIYIYIYMYIYIYNHYYFVINDKISCLIFFLKFTL